MCADVPPGASRIRGGRELKTVLAVYASGLLQGISLILFPAAGPLLTDPQFHGLTSSQFGILFTPQIIAAIVASTAAARFAARFGMKRVLLAGLLADVLAMLLLAASQLVIHSGSPAFVLLLLATGAVGFGFGLTITALNTYAFDLFRDRPDAAVTGLHVLTGIGQVLASIILGLFLGLGSWWGAPTAVGVALALMLGFQLGLPMTLSHEGSAPNGKGKGSHLPGRVWLYAAAVFLYGICETTFGNWSPIYLEQDAGLTISDAGLALAVFWGAVTTGRVLFALVAVWLRPQILYLFTPLLVGTAFLSLPSLAGSASSMLALGLAGLGLSFFFPLSISLASTERPDLASAISGTMVAAIMLGSGFGSNSVGLVREAIGLPLVFRLSSLYAFLMAAIVVGLSISGKSALGTSGKSARTS
ncbi:MAG: MFS transporter [Chloroflexi bacterium]|nr:MFS transporter [Chloroflexota bacterium]